MNEQQDRGRFIWLVAAVIIWLGFAFAIGAAGTLRNLHAQTIPMIVALLTAIVLLVCWRVAAARATAMSLNVRYILGFHLMRFIAGLFFLIDASNGRLSAAFAYLAAIGD